MGEKLLLIFNMHSGKTTIKNHAAGIIDIFNRCGFEVTAWSTQARGHATELVKEKGAEYPLIVCCGGDGTLSEVIDGLMYFPEKKRPKLGYIPAGPTNDFASTLQLPTKISQSTELVMKQTFARIDIGSFLDDYFVYVAAFGAFTAVSYNTPQQNKNILGHQAYIIEGIRQVSNIRPYHMKVTVGGEVIEGDFVYGMVYNADSVGGFKNLSGKQVELDDGELDVMLIKAPDNAVEWPALLTDLLTKNNSSKFIHSYRISSITFEADEETDWVLDGEYGGAHKKVEISTAHQAIEMAVDLETLRRQGVVRSAV